MRGKVGENDASAALTEAKNGTDLPFPASFSLIGAENRAFSCVSLTDG